MPTIERTELVVHTAAQMYDLVNDVEKYPEFLPWCSDSQILEQDEDTIHASVTVAGAGLHKTFTTLNRLQKHKMIEIRLVDGPFHHLEGFWLFEPLEEGGSSITVDMEFEFSGSLLDFAFGPIFHQVSSSMVDAFCQRADSLYGNTNSD